MRCSTTVGRWGAVTLHGAHPQFNKQMLLIILYFALFCMAIVEKPQWVINVNYWRHQSAPHLIGVDDQHCFAVHLLDLFWCDQVSHAHRLPACLSLPQDCVHGGQQSTDVAFFPLDPVQDLRHKQQQEKRTQTFRTHYFKTLKYRVPCLYFLGVHLFGQLFLPHLCYSSGPFFVLGS